MIRPRHSVVPPINLDRNSRVSLPQQIYAEIARAIGSGCIQHEARLPATQTLARLLGVSRNTVIAAYEDLAAADLISAKRGSGMWVNGSSRRVMSSSCLRNVGRAANYPERLLLIKDLDGNSLYLNS